MSQFNIDEIEKNTLKSLKDFQLATVDRVDYLFRKGQNRVLVADEVGMGKTLIARGTIVKMTRLWLEEKKDLFKVIYICPNQNIANQNIRKLDVTGKISAGSVSDTRLSMQHLKITELEKAGVICGYHTLIDWDKISDEKVTALIEVRVTPQRGQGFDSFRANKSYD